MEQIIHFLTHEFSPFTGGIGIYVEEMARACVEGGALPRVWSPNYGNQSSHAYPYEVERIRMRGKQDWICRWKMGRSFSAKFPDRKARGTVVLAEPGPIRWWMYSKVTRPPVPDRLIVILHGSEAKKLTAFPHRRLLFRNLLRKADCIGVVSHCIKEMLLLVYPELERNVILVPGAVRSSWRNELVSGRENRRKELIQVGRIHPRKGQLELVKAMGRLPEELRTTYTLRLIGPISRAEYATEIRKTAEMSGVILEMTGVLEESDLKNAYQGAAVTIMPSQRYKTSIEGLGIALLEAQHFGCPVIGTDIGGIREAMIPEETGLLVPPGDTSALVGAIQKILQDIKQAEVMGVRGAHFVRENFSWEQNVRALELI